MYTKAQPLRSSKSRLALAQAQDYGNAMLVQSSIWTSSGTR